MIGASRDVASPMAALARDGDVLVSVYVANTFWSRLKGLHGVPPLAIGEGLLITPCNSIHTLTMRDAIDVVFLSTDGFIKQLNTVAPRTCSRCRGATHCLELPPGSISALALDNGQPLVFRQGETG